MCTNHLLNNAIKRLQGSGQRLGSREVATLIWFSNCLVTTKLICSNQCSRVGKGSYHQMLQRRIPTSHVHLRNFLFFINSRPLCASGELYYHFSFSNKIPLLPVRGLFSVNISSHPSKQTLCIFRAIWKR